MSEQQSKQDGNPKELQIDAEPEVIPIDQDAPAAVVAPVPPKKQAVVVYEGDERWKGGNVPLSDDEDDEDERPPEASIENQEEYLKDYPSDTEASFTINFPCSIKIDIPAPLQELELLHSRIASVSALKLPRFAKSLKKLCLRQNSITELDPAEFGPLILLEELDIYDNQVKDIGDALKDMKNLKYTLYRLFDSQCTNSKSNC